MAARHVLVGIGALALIHAACPALAQEKLAVWWIKGFYQAEDDALFAAIRKYERKSGVKVEVSQYTVEDMDEESMAALDGGKAPDLAYSDTYDSQTVGKWAYDGKLEDLSDVLVPIRDRFDPVALSTTNLFNNKLGKRSYYAFPVRQQSIQVHYWKDMLAQAGMGEGDVPGTWKEYWSFWCDKVQPAIRRATGRRIYGTGLPLGVRSTDSSQTFLTWLDAYNVRLVDKGGGLLVDDPKVKRGLAASLADYADIYVRGCTPPASTTWNDPDNNIAFHNRAIVMTQDPGMSIAAKWLDDAGNRQLTAEQRAAGRRAYEERIATARLPNKPDGSPMVYRTSVKVGVIFDAAKNKARAKDFLSFMLEEENLRPYVEGGNGRWFPVTRAGQGSTFWQTDKHRQAVYEEFKAGTIPYEFTRNYKFTILDRENVWAKSVNSVVNETLSVDKAVEELVRRIREVAG